MPRYLPPHTLKLALLMVAAGLCRSLAGQEVVIRPPSPFLVSNLTHTFTAVVNGAPEGPIVWSVVKGPGSIDAATGVFTPAAASMAAVTIGAELKGRPDVTGRVRVNVLDPNLTKVLGEAALATLGAHTPDWLQVYLERLPFNNPETDALPPGVEPFRSVEEGHLRLNSKDPGSPTRFAGIGLPFLIDLDPLDLPKARTFISWGRPGGRWNSREVTGEPTTRLLPSPNTRMIKVQSTAPSRDGGFITRKRSVRIKLHGLHSLAGRDNNPGNDNGTGTAARFTHPSGMALTDPGTDRWRAYVSDSATHCLRLVTPTGRVLTVSEPGGGAPVDGLLVRARFNQPTFMVSRVISPSDSKQSKTWVTYVADTGNNVIRCISAGKVTTFAGTGRAEHADADRADQAAFCRPLGLALDKDGNLYVADSGNYVIRRISAQPPHAVTTIAGIPGRRSTLPGHPDPGLCFQELKGLAMSPSNLVLSIVDGDSVRSLILSTGICHDLGLPDRGGFANGTISELKTAMNRQPRLRRPWGLHSTPWGILIADEGNSAIRLLTDVPGPAKSSLWGLFTLVGGEELPRRFRPGLVRHHDFLPGFGLREYFAALGSPRNLLLVPGEEAGKRDCLVADGTSLGLISDMFEPGALTRPQLSVASDQHAGRPFKVTFVPSSLPPDPGTGLVPGAPFYWYLGLTDLTGKKELWSQKDGSWGPKVEAVEMDIKEPGAYRLTLTVMSQDGRYMDRQIRSIQALPPLEEAPAAQAVAPPKPAPKSPGPPRPTVPKTPPLPILETADPASGPEDSDSEPDSDGESSSWTIPAPFALSFDRETKEPMPRGALLAEPNGLTDSGSGSFLPLGVPDGRKRLLNLGFRLKREAFEHIRARHVSACEVEEGEPIPGRFDRAFGTATALRNLLADGLEGIVLNQGKPGNKPGRMVFLCRVAQVGTVEFSPGSPVPTDCFKVVAERKETGLWQVITAFPVAAPSGEAVPE